MGLPKTASFDEFVLEIGDGATPEAFTRKCGLVTKSSGITSSLGSSEIPDCTDESLPSTLVQSVKSVSEELSGNGVFVTTDYAFYRAWALSGAAKNIRVTLAKDNADGGGSWITPYVLSSFKNAVNKGEEMTADLTFSSSGALGAFAAADA